MNNMVNGKRFRRGKQAQMRWQLTGFIRLGEVEWKVTKATLSATILPLDEADHHWGPGTGGMAWHLEIDTERKKINSEMMDPLVYVQLFVATVRTWKEMEGKEFHWPNLPFPDDAHDRERPSICIFEHDDIFKSRVRFGKRQESSFAFTLTGEYAFFKVAPEPIVVETLMRFSGIDVKADNEGQAHQRLCEHLDSSHFSSTPIAPGRPGGGHTYFFFEANG